MAKLPFMKSLLYARLQAKYFEYTLYHLNFIMTD